MKQMKTCFATLFVFEMLLTLTLGFVATADAQNACSKAAKDVLAACRQGAESDYTLAIAKCDNAPSDPKCANDALAEKNDGLQECKDEFDVRSGACDQLGPEAYDPVINPSNFVKVIDNPFFPLEPGTTYIYETQTPDGVERDEFAVTHHTRVIDGVTCVEVHDTVRLDGKLTENTLDWFAQDVDGNVWYFGENTQELENGLITTIDGTFMAGVDRAKPGIIMEASNHVGDFYRQEFDLQNAEDYAEVVGLNATVTVPTGTYNKCLKTKETTPLEPDVQEDKYYCRGVGNVLEVDRSDGQRTELIQIKKNL
jgi:hypothetical protein